MQMNCQSLLITLFPFLASDDVETPAKLRFFTILSLLRWSYSNFAVSETLSIHEHEECHSFVCRFIFTLCIVLNPYKRDEIRESETRRKKLKILQYIAKILVKFPRFMSIT